MTYEEFKEHLREKYKGGEFTAVTLEVSSEMAIFWITELVEDSTVPEELRVAWKARMAEHLLRKKKDGHTIKVIDEFDPASGQFVPKKIDH